MGENQDRLKERLIRFRRRLEERCRVERLVLFGSTATGTARPDSDVDLILVSPDFRGTPFILRAVGLRRLWDERIPMDLICYTPEEFDERAGKITIVKQALEEGMEIV